MTKDELLKKYDELTSIWLDKEAKLEAYIQKWLDGDNVLSSDSTQQVVDTVTAQIAQLKEAANQVILEYTRLGKEEALKELGLKSAKQSVKKHFGSNPDEIIISGGTLSSNASETNLKGRLKTQDELELERQSALAEIRNLVANKQISLSEASKLKSDVNLAYGYSKQSEEISNGMKTK